MIDANKLLGDLRRLLKVIEDDLRRRINEIGDLKVILQAEWQTARDANRTAETFESWADQVITQAAVHWLLSCVFLRFIEDNRLVERPWLGGTPESGRLALARDRHETYFGAHPLESDREYFIFSFREAGALPGLRTFFDEKHNPIFRLGISGDAAMALRQFWQQVDPNSGNLVHDFTDPEWNTRFLGDLYQDLSEATRKRYALLQTPEFVEEFILDRTLTPAIREFGFREVRMIDATCGSGHFVLGGFHRMVVEWQRAEPGRNRRDVAQKALDAVAGVDLNPFAVAISRFRMLVAALKTSEVRRLSEAPDFHINMAIGDSLLHGKRFGLTATDDMFQGAVHFADTGLAHAYTTEDLREVQRILGRQYHAVVGNPPYIVVRDAALNTAYRSKYASCHRQYSLGAPFTERFFELAITGRDTQPAGFVGLITSNSFMKREFGSKLIERVLPRLDLTHVIDTSGAYIPGHGTPTVILCGRHCMPVGETVRTVMGVKSEPCAPDDAAQGLVWSAIIRQIDQPGSESDFVSVADIPRSVFGKHPWSMGGGGASDVKVAIEEAASTQLTDVVDAIGYVCMTRADDVYFVPKHSLLARGVPIEQIIENVEGDAIRDWRVIEPNTTLFPYQRDSLLPLQDTEGSALHRCLWPYRKVLWLRREPNGNHLELGLTWWEWSRFQRDRFRVPLSIAFAFVATNNHFVFDRGGRCYKQSAPVIKLPPGASEDDHLGLLALLNSSVACFWLQQMCHNKGRPGAETAGADERYEMRYEFDSTKLALFPLVGQRPVKHAATLEKLGERLSETSPAALLRGAELPTRSSLNAALGRTISLRNRMIAKQEELDWHCYGIYHLLPEGIKSAEVECDDPGEVTLGERAFEIVLARRVAAGLESTTWFERHGSAPITEIPIHWPEDYRLVVQHRIDLIESERNIALIERPEYKRRWNSPSWESMEQAALRSWLLSRLESPYYWTTSADRPPQLNSTSRLADAAEHDADFMQISELYAGHAHFDPGQLVADLVASEAVPFLPVLRYTDTGLRKRAQWEETWVLQRREDAGEKVSNIPVPPRYQNKDFLKTEFWRLRGSLDVPKERWISYPGCERGADGSLPIAWAGWNYLRQATALAGYYVEMKDSEGWEPTRLQPLLAGLLELVPWLEQWHNDVDSVYGERMGNYYKGFVSEEARALGFTLDELKAWMPQASVKRSRKKVS